MSDWKLPWHASCLCGQVKMRITAAPVVTMACHCKGCQRLTSAPYSLSMLIPEQGFEQSGETELGGLRRADAQHHYCTQCKSWVFSRAPAMQDLVNFKATMLDDASWVVPYADCYAPNMLAGVVTGAKLRFDEFPPPERYGEIMAAYAREGVRPK